MSRLFKDLVKRSSLWRCYTEALLRKDEQRRFMAEAKQEVAKRNLQNPEKILSAYHKDLLKYMFTFFEWYDMYAISDADEKVKKQYISRSKAQKYYRSLINPATRQIFRNKPQFLKNYSSFIHRNYLEVDENLDIEKFSEFLHQGDVIVKPVDGSLGAGVYKITAEEAKNIDLKKLLGRCKKEHCLIEECVEGHPDIQAFHPNSLNTIRVMTARDGDIIRVFGSFIRFGSGNAVIDNAHAGGLFCTINIKTGTLSSDCQIVMGGYCKKHPDSGIPFRGFQIPRWGEICQTCIKAHSLCDLPFAGWDVCITSNNEIEIIEGNHAPDVDLIQGPLHQGCRQEFESICKKYKRQWH